MEGPGADPLPASLAASDERAFAALYDRFGRRLYRAAMGMLGRREDAEDIVQEVFMAVLQTWPRLSNSQDLTAYLFTALRRAAARSAARRARAQALSETAADEAAAERGRPDNRSSPYSERLQRTLLALPAEQREVVALKIDGELSFAEIAQVMGVSINTAASRYRYALEKLRTSLSNISSLPPGENKQ
jgi:RNA polymerase sigma-70 factor, ECF subfamily